MFAKDEQPQRQPNDEAAEEMPTDKQGGRLDARKEALKHSGCASYEVEQGQR
jgi:hypothetical protein